ncbi:TspO/MBR family protein [Allosphingosinicella sp.]|uniref:TspO/MBR family protein n=1 Tax=Allosphingosinicella sp. TaxID=2823234 RepID=UPI002FC1134C
MTGIASRAQLRMSFLRYALVTIPLVLLLGTLSGRASGNGYGNPWFDALVKPEAMPPGWVFAAVWTLLYIWLGLVLAMILHARGAERRVQALALFLAQLLLNFAWSPVFFVFREVATGLTMIAAMIVLSVAATWLIARIRKAAALLMLPYIAWLCFAAYLNYQIVVLNPGADALVPSEGSADILI